MSKNKVMVVDDDKSITELVQKKLELVGITADAAHSAEEGLQAMRKNLYTVVVLDIHMPGMDGPEMIGLLKDISPVAQVIMLTSDSSFERVIECLDRGAVDFFAKEMQQLILMAESVSAALGRGARWASWMGLRSGWDQVPTPQVSF